MNNHNISASKKFNILTKLMKNQKFSTISTLIENDSFIDDPKQKGDILNKHFVSKTVLPGHSDDPPQLQKRDILNSLNTINTSPIEVAKIIRNSKKSNQSHCGVPGKFLSLISTPISFPLSRLFNNMFEAGFFPDSFKVAHKHLGVYLTSTLDWRKQVHEVCLKANFKLSVLRSVKFLQRSTLDLLYKLTVRSVVDYGLFIFYII